MTTKTNTTKKCICCLGEIHHLSLCFKFKSLSTNERWNFITANKICFSCLTPFHNVKSCKRRKSCGIQECKKPHHELLHKHLEGTTDVNTNSDEVTVNNRPSATNCHISTNQSVLLKILPVVVSYGHKSIDTYVLLDDASTITLIDQDFADSLKLSGPLQTLCLQWTNDDIIHKQNDSRIVSFTVSSRDKTRSFQLRHVRTTKLSLPSQTIEIEKLKST